MLRSTGVRFSRPTWGEAPGSALSLQLLDGGAHALRSGLAEGGDADVGQALLRLLPLLLCLALAGCLPAGAQPALVPGLRSQGSELRVQGLDCRWMGCCCSITALVVRAVVLCLALAVPGPGWMPACWSTACNCGQGQGVGL